MAGLLTDFPVAASPSPADTALALESSQKLAHLIQHGSIGASSLQIQPSDSSSAEAISIPPSAFRLIQEILVQMAQGNAVTLIPIHAELTTQQAADLLHVSRPFLIEQLEKNALPYRKVGTHRRILYKDLIAFKESMDRNRLKALDELSKLDQELGLGY